MQSPRKRLLKITSASDSRSYYIQGALVIFLVALIGTLLLTGSHAANPYVAVNTDTGTPTSPAQKIACPGSTDGNCIQFGSATTGGNTGGGANMVVGLGGGGWGTSGIIDQLTATPYLRIDQARGVYAAQDISDLTSRGGKAIIDFSTDSNGQYNTGGVQAINATNWVSSALAWYKSACPVATKCPMIEVLNEPSGSWFWGSNSNSQSNALAYANLVKSTYIAFHDPKNGLGTSSPLILASYDNSNWAGWWWSSAMAPYVDGIVVHPYGGTGSTDSSKLGNRSLVTTAHNFTSKPIYVTEVGWPTAVGQRATGDSLQWPESSSTPGSTAGDQCNNAYNFIAWSKSTNYVNAVVLFGYRDYTSTDNSTTPPTVTDMWYGVERWGEGNGTVDGSQKPVLAALHNQYLKLGNPCPNPVSY